MLKYRGSSLIRSGFIGVVLIVLVIAVGLQPETTSLPWATSIKHQALFTEAGGLVPGNDVKVSGVKVGTVSSVALQRGKALVTFMVNGNVRLGLGHHRAHPHRNAAGSAGADAGVRRQGHPEVRRRDSGVPHRSAVFVDRRRSASSPRTPPIPTPRR